MSLSRYIFFLFVIVSLCGCDSHSMDDFREKGESLTRSLITVFKDIHTRQELLDAQSKLRRLFNEMVDIMILAQEFRQKQLEAEMMPITPQGQILSDQLRMEMNRIYSTIEGGREIVEKCQEPALHRLDAFTKRANRLKTRQAS